MSFGFVYDASLRASMGRERQIKPAFVNVAVFGDVNPRLSYRVVANPVDDQVRPRPYRPQAGDPRQFFFPNQPEGQGVVSDPSGLYRVDDYKYSGLDPILQQGDLRIALIDVHARSRRYGLRLGRDYVRQGLGLDEIVWFTAKDLTHIQRINAQADNGVSLYANHSGLHVDLSIISGNGNPYHDYGYFDFTDSAEDKNSAVGAVLSVRMRQRYVTAGGTIRKNYTNSRIESSTSLQLSKHYDDAAVAFARVTPMKWMELFGEYVRYRWGLAQSSASLLPGPRVRTPVIKNGYYLGTRVVGPPTRLGTWGVVVTREELSRDDSLVAWASANQLFGASLGKKERSTIIKAYVIAGRNVTAFTSVMWLSNPFPLLSAIQPLDANASSQPVSNTKYEFGIRFTM